MKRILVVIALAMLTGCGQVDPGERAVFVTWGKMDQACYGPGFYWYNPISTNMDEINVQTQAFKMEKMSAATKDLQEVHADVILNYALDGKECHRLITEVGHDYQTKVLIPALQDALKAGTAHFAIAEIIQNRDRLREEVTKALKMRVAPYYILVAENGVNLTNFDVSKAYMAAIEAKQIEEQRALQKAYQVVQAQRDAEIKAAKAKGDADAVREAAKGEADALRFKGLAQAEYNEKVAKSLSPILVQQQWIDAWRAGGSQVPTVDGGGSGGFLFQVPLPKKLSGASNPAAAGTEHGKVAPQAWVGPRGLGGHFYSVIRD